MNRPPWEAALRDREVEQSWENFKGPFHRAQELMIPRSKKSGKEGKRLAWLSQDLLVKLKVKKTLAEAPSSGLPVPKSVPDLRFTFSPLELAQVLK